jgi:transposase
VVSRRQHREKPAEACYPQCPLDLTENEKSLLEEWAQGESRVARRAKAILAASRTANITDISRYSGLYRGSIYFWLERFQIARLNGIFRNELGGLTFAERQQLDAAKSGSDPVFAKRAAFILEIAQKPDLASAAAKARISINAARLWRRTFKRAGVEGLAHPTNDRLGPLPKLNNEELAVMRQWSTAGRGFSRRATLILALIEGESVSSAAARVGLTKASVFYWRKQFICGGLNAIAPKRLLEVQDNERHLLKELQSDPSSQVSRRASLLWDFRECGDLMAAAKRQNVSLTSARNWKRAFEQRGVAGVKKPKLAPPALPRHPLPLILPIQLPVDVRVRLGGRDLEASGTTTTLSSRYFMVALNDDRNRVVGIDLGARVTAHVQWPAAGLEGKRLRLRIVGSVLQAYSTTICISIRTFAFECT